MHVANEERGVSRPRSARTVLSAERVKRKLDSLSLDPDISMVVRGAEAAKPYTKKQSAGLTIAMVIYIARKWGSSRSWWKRQMAALIVLGFVSLMRMGELCALKTSDVMVVYADGSEVELQDLQKVPKAAEVAGLLLHLPWRKNHATQDCWVPVACKATIALLLQQASTLRRRKCKSEYLFPSRRGSEMNRANHIRGRSANRALVQALLECVPLMTPAWAKLYTGHALRVGGSNHMRRIGVADDVHRRMGGWMTLVAAQGYMALSTSEQFACTLKLSKSKRRRAALTRTDVVRAFRALPSLSAIV